MLAIIIPYFKLTFFETTLQSLACQTDQRFKVYIGDDASPENPEDLLKKYKGKFDFVYHRFATNLGGMSLTQQWDRCIALSGDEQWIMILGDDDVLSDNLVEGFYNNFDEMKSEAINVARFSTQIIDELGKSISDIYKHPKLEKSADFLYRKLKGFTRSSLSEYVFTRESYSKYKFRNYPLGWHSDDIAWIDFTEGKQIYFIDKSIVLIRISDFNISGKKDNEVLKSNATILFYEDLFREKLNLLKSEERHKLLVKYELEIKKGNRLDLMKWMFLVRTYFLNVGFIPFLKLIRRIFIYYFVSKINS